MKAKISRNIFSNLRNRHFILIDVILLSLTPTLALGLRVSFPWYMEYYYPLLIFTILSLLIKLLVFSLFKLYSRYWRYASVDEMISIALAVMVSTILNSGLFWILQGLINFGTYGFPRSIPFIDGLLTLLVIGGTRFSTRIIQYWQFRGTQSHVGKRVLIVGAGAAGQMVVREIISRRLITFDPVGYVDDDPEKIGAVIQGIPVLGAINTIPSIVGTYSIEEVIIAIPSAAGSTIRNIIALCKSVRVPSRTVPSIYEILDGKVSVNQLRKVEINDLLRRSPVQIDISNVQEMLSGKRILITGAGGTIGSELCRQIYPFQPANLILLGHGENSLFSLDMQLSKIKRDKKDFSPTKINFVVGDIRNKQRLSAIFTKYSPQIIFHAAAHKHVPMMEENPDEAVTNNILGTYNLVNVSIENQIERFVLISTDKAVNPTSIMGMTKQIAEMIVSEAAQKTHRSFLSVRFGNVLGSRGSAVHIFQDQIDEGGPITVTHPDIKRYFMTISEAVLLVLQAAALGEGGAVYVLDMGEPIKLIELVQDMIELSGYQSGKDIEIVYTGLRPGEKLTEELFSEGENPTKTTHEKIYVARNAYPNLDKSFSKQVMELIQTAQDGNSTMIREKLNNFTQFNRHLG